MFSKSCEYAIRACILICQNSEKNLVTNVKEISKEVEVPEQYIAKVLQILSRQNIVQSVKGPGGGFYFSEDQPPVKLIEIVTAIDTEEIFTRCGLGLKQCSEKKPCPLHNHFKDIRNDLRKMLSDTTLKDLSDGLKKGMVISNRMKKISRKKA